MTTQLSVDRFEGDGKATAVLLDDDGHAVNFPRAWLPKGTRAGDVLTLTLAPDPGAARKVADEARQVQGELKGRDRGGDLKL